MTENETLERKMQYSLSITAAVTVLLFLAACGGKTAGTPLSAVTGPCENADNVSYVKGAVHCLAIKTFASSDGAAKTLVVVLHGDLSRGGGGDYIFPVAERASQYGAIGVAMMRPGYTGGGRRSSGTPSRSQHRWDVYRGEEIDSIATAVAALKKHHAVERVVMVGHSGGALISGVMLGRAAPLVDAALLVSCPCDDIAEWRSRKNRRPLLNAESPIHYLSSVPKAARIFALTGDRDDNTTPDLAQKYVEEAKRLGLDASFILLRDAGHGFRRIGGQTDFRRSLKQAIGAG